MSGCWERTVGRGERRRQLLGTAILSVGASASGLDMIEQLECCVLCTL